MKRIGLALTLCLFSTSSFAAAAGGAGCGWGNALFEGQSGKAAHILALTTNGSTGNNTLGVTSGTNGCSSSGTIQYGGKAMADVSNVMDEFSEDIARGDGEVLTAFAVSLGIAAEDRAAFKAAMHDNFAVIFPSEDVTMEQVAASVLDIMSQDESLNQYI